MITFLYDNITNLLFYRQQNELTQQNDEVHETALTADGVIESNWDQVAETFDDMNLKENLLRGIYGFGFEKPSAIQQRAIVPCCTGRDVIAQAQSGTGKTATFTVSVLQRVDPEIKEVQALIMAPTRELAQQIDIVMRALGEYMGISFHVCIGGTNVQDDRRKLEGGAQVIVGTPGRVNDMIVRGHLKTDHIKMFVLDEADEMLSRGFKDQIYEVFKNLPNDVQVVLLSATMPAEVLDVTKKFMRDPIRILIKKEEITLEGIRQFYIMIEKEVSISFLIVLFYLEYFFRNGSLIHYVIYMIQSTLLKPSFSVILVEKLKNSPKIWKVVNLRFLSCMVKWNKLNVI